ncbi:MAG TPA: tetratricopeptide repeat protein [Polyangiaceae bacterium]|nr:tetratricopeptide repeat protein [Polyangiaceae bacterium]
MAEDGQVDPRLARARVYAATAEGLFDQGHYAAALAEYTRVYEALAGHPRQYWVLYNLAACHERLFQYDLALARYEEYLTRAPESEKDRAEVAAITRTLRSLLATLVVQSSVPSEVWVDDRRMGTTPGHWLVGAGRHIVEVRAELYGSERREVQLKSGSSELLRFELQRLSTYAGPGRGFFWASAGLSAAAVIAGSAFGMMALSAHRDGRDRARASLDTSAEARRARDWSLAADVGFGSAILFGATATVLYFVTDWRQPTTDRSRTAARSRRSAMLRPRAELDFSPSGRAAATLAWEF